MVNEKKPKYYGALYTNNFLLSGQLGLGINFDMGQRINLSLTTAYTHSLTNFYDGSTSSLVL